MLTAEERITNLSEQERMKLAERALKVVIPERKKKPR